LSMTRAGQTYYYLYDHLGSVIGLTDGAGTLVASYRYDPWGNVIATGGSNPGLSNPFRFTGREWDAESGFYFLRTRYYDPAVGRFISADWAGINAGETNAYVYALNSPTNLTDPFGLTRACFTKWFQCGLAILAGAGTAAGVVLLAPVTAPALLVGAVAVGAGTVAGTATSLGVETIKAATGQATCWGDAWSIGWRGGFFGAAVATIGLMASGAQGAWAGTSAGEMAGAAWTSASNGARNAWQAIKNFNGPRPQYTLEQLAEIVAQSNAQQAAMRAAFETFARYAALGTAVGYGGLLATYVGLNIISGLLGAYLYLQGK
jgi:RHS repeat-associated protein